MRSWLAIAAVFCSLSPALAGPEWDTALAGLDQTVKSEAAKLNGPSFSVAVISLRHPAHFASYGYADVARKVPASAHTIYEIGSISKVFTGTMLMQMRDAGKASLDDPLQKHLPEFHMPSPFTGETRPSLRQLVSHTSGLPRMTPRYSELEGERGSDKQMIASLEQTEPVFAPFTQFKYSNLDIGLAGYALARTAGMPWSEYIDRTILALLGMKESSAARRNLPASHIAQGYVPGPDGSWHPGTPMEFPPLTEASGAMLSSAADLAKFAQWQLDERDDRVLSAVSRREMRAPLWMEDSWKKGNGIAWSLERRGDEILALHGGGTNGYSALLCVDAKLGVAIVVLGNSMADAQGLALRLLDPLLAVAKAEKAAEDAVVPSLPADVEQLTGTYVHDIGMVPPVTVKVENGVLVMDDDNWGKVRLRPQTVPRHFTATGNYPLTGETVSFEGEGPGMRLLIGHGSVIYRRTP